MLTSASRSRWASIAPMPKAKPVLNEEATFTAQVFPTRTDGTASTQEFRSADRIAAHFYGPAWHFGVVMDESGMEFTVNSETEDKWVTFRCEDGVWTKSDGGSGDDEGGWGPLDDLIAETILTALGHE